MVVIGLFLLHFQTWRAHTERAKARLWEQQYVDYGWEVCALVSLSSLVAYPSGASTIRGSVHSVLEGLGRQLSQ